MRNWRIVAGVAAATGVTIGLGLGSVLGGDAREGSPARTGGTAPASLEAPAPKGPESVAQRSGPEWMALEDALAREREARITLAEEIDMLWEELELIAQSAEPSSPIAEPPAPGSAAVKAGGAAAKASAGSLPEHTQWDDHWLVLQYGQDPDDRIPYPA